MTNEAGSTRSSWLLHLSLATSPKLLEQDYVLAIVQPFLGQETHSLQTECDATRSRHKQTPG